MSKETRKAPIMMVVLAFAIVYIVWGSTYFFIQVAVQQIPPMMIGAFRFIIAGALLLGWCVITKEGIGSPQQIRIAAVTGLLMLLGGTGAVIWAEKWLPSSLVAILISSAPFWFVILDFPKWKANFSNKFILAGLFAGFIGVLMMFGERLTDAFHTPGGGIQLAGLAFTLFATMSWAAGSLISKYHAPGSTTLSSAWQMLSAGAVFLLGSLLLGEWKGFDFTAVPAGAWMSVAYLIFFGSLAAFSCYIWLLKVRSAATVSTYAYVNPLIAILLGVAFAGEHMSILQVFGFVIILGSVLLINTAR